MNSMPNTVSILNWRERRDPGGRLRAHNNILSYSRSYIITRMNPVADYITQQHTSLSLYQPVICIIYSTRSVFIKITVKNIK